MRYFLLFSFVFFTALSAETLSGKVVSVADGDTITILDDSKAQYKIRFEHIDTPEKKQAFGQKAKEYLSSMVFGKTVKVLVKEKDRYGRNIGTVLLDEKNINLAMVKAGLAWHYKKYSKDKTFAAAEALARGKKKGLWLDPKPIPPWEYNENIIIRLEHIDAPELNQKFGFESKKFLSRLILNEKIKAVILKTDKYNRKIASVYIDGQNVNLALVEAGLAWHFTKYSKNEKYTAAQKNAKTSKKGLWAQMNAIPPWEFRNQKNKY